MNHSRKFNRGPSSYQRGKPRHPPSGKAILIVTEGKKTEPNYLKALRDRLRLSSTDVVIMHPEGTDPITLTRKAIELRENRKNQSRKGIVSEYDEVWIVFDMETPHNERRELAKNAMTMPEAVGIKFAISDPAFEYWLLLHYPDGYTTSPCVSCEVVIKKLKKFWPDYAKGLSPTPEFIDQLPIAVKHAERCRKHHRDSSGDYNPSTKMDKLARCMNEATRSHFQFDLGPEDNL